MDSFLFAVLLLTVPPCPAVCKSEGARAPVPYGVGATENYISLIRSLIFISYFIKSFRSINFSSRLGLIVQRAN